jgi:hypothetical protein
VGFKMYNIRISFDCPNTCGSKENNRYNNNVSMTYGIPYKISLNTCDHAKQPFNDFHKLRELKRALNENMDY